MTERFMAMLAMEQASVVSSETLVHTLRRRFPDLAISSTAIDPKVRPGESGEAYMLEIVGMQFTVMFIDQPTPPGTYDGAAKQSLLWPDAAKQLEKEKAHAIVAAFAPADRFETAVRSASLVTLIAAAIAELTPCLGLYWVSGETVTDKNTFLVAAQRVVEGQFPVEIWVQIAFFGGGQGDDGVNTVSAMTTGLKALVGREIEFQPSAIPPTVLASRLIGTIQYLLMKGPVFTDGDTLGISESERIRVRLAASKLRPELPVYVLNLEQVDDAAL